MPLHTRTWSADGVPRSSPVPRKNTAQEGMFAMEKVSGVAAGIRGGGFEAARLDPP